MRKLPRAKQQQIFKARTVSAREPNNHKHSVAIGRLHAAVDEQHIAGSVDAQTAASRPDLNRGVQLSGAIEPFGSQTTRCTNIQVSGILVMRTRGERL